ncbi:MAG: flagellar hook-length control protein FliK [Paenibacillaceae bacterium]|nr:flagellar hook-length control protein FliK [Paenibacillaceae bacterium]
MDDLQKNADHTVDDSSDLAALLANNPQLLDQILQEPKFQLWLDQAAVVLQSMNLLPGNFNEMADLTGNAVGSFQGNSQLLVSEQQAQTVLAAFQSIVAKDPGNSQLQQLSQSFQQFMESFTGSRLPLLNEVMGQRNPMNVEREDKKSGVVTSSVTNAGLDSGSSDKAGDMVPVTSNSVVKDSSSKQQNGGKFTGKGDLIMLTGTSAQEDTGSGSTKVGNLVSMSSRIATPDAGTELQVEVKPKSLLHLLAAKSLNATTDNTLPVTIPAVDARNIVMQQVPATAPTFVQPTINSLHFTQDMSQFLMNQLHLVHANGVSEATITLYPQHLGQVDVKLTMQDGVLAAQFTAGTALGKDLLENQLPQLRAALQTQGLQVDKLVVNQSASMSSGMFQGHSFQQQSQFNQQSKNRQRGVSYEGIGDDFSIELSAVAQMRATAYGNSFDVTA